MKSLYIIRHAKSSWATPTLPDFERPLNKRGLNDAPLMGRVLAEKGIKVDLILASPAHRAISTARLIAAEIGYPVAEIETDRHIYHANVDDLLEIIGLIDDQYEKVAIFGHNPTFTYLSNYFTNANIANMPTNGVVAVAFDTESWETISPQNASLLFFEYPKLHNIK